MKKLMIAMAAMTAGIAVADVVSSDIVGYAQSGLKYGASMATPQFVNVSGAEGMPLQSIIPQGDDLVDNVYLKTLDAYGRTVEGCDYTWNDWNYSEPCWVDSNYEKVEGVTIPAGLGLWVYGSSNSQYLRFPAPEL